MQLNPAQVQRSTGTSRKADRDSRNARDHTSPTTASPRRKQTRTRGSRLRQRGFPSDPTEWGIEQSPRDPAREAARRDPRGGGKPRVARGGS